MKVAYILSGVPGAGKSTVAKSIAGDHGVVCEADAFHYVDGEYKFNPARVGYCHQQCFEQFEMACKKGVEIVVCSNTNTTPKEWKRYAETAELLGYTVFKMIVENHHDNDSIHSVPQGTREAMAERIKQSMKLI